MKTYSIEPMRVLERYKTPLYEITKHLGNYLELDANEDGKILSWRMMIGKEERLVPTERLKRELEEIVFTLGSEAIAETESNIELHTEKEGAREVSGYIFADELPLHQRIALGLVHVDDQTKVPWSAEVIVEWDDNMPYAYLGEIWVNHNGENITLSSRQYDDSKINESVTESYSSVYEEDRVSSAMDWSPYED